MVLNSPLPDQSNAETEHHPTRRAALLAIAAFLAAPALTCTREKTGVDQLCSDLRALAVGGPEFNIDEVYRGDSATTLLIPRERHYLGVHQQHALTIAALAEAQEDVMVVMEGLPTGPHDAQAIDGLYREFFQTPNCNIAPLERNEARAFGRDARPVRSFDDYLEMNPVLKLCYQRPEIKLMGAEDASLLHELNKLHAALGLVEVARAKYQSLPEGGPEFADQALSDLRVGLAQLVSEAPSTLAYILRLADREVLQALNLEDCAAYAGALHRLDGLNRQREAAMIESISHTAQSGMAKSLYIIIGADHRPALLETLKQRGLTFVALSRGT